MAYSSEISEEVLERKINYMLILDCKISRALSIYNGSFTRGTFERLLIILKVLEWTGHGVPWLIFVSVLAYVTYDDERDFYINLFIGLIFDLIVIAVLKLTFRRSRPDYNEGDLPLSASRIDGYAFPSGHTTRAFMVLVMFQFFNIVTWKKNVLAAWAIILSLSRVVLGRHHLSDVIAGVLVGCFEAYIVLRYLWYSLHTVTNYDYQIHKDL